MSGDVFVSRFAAPSHVTVGEDGIPDFVSGVKGDPRRYVAPPGYKLVVMHNAKRLRYVTEADRKAGWAVGLHYFAKDDGSVQFNPTDANGVSQHRFYEGRITFHLERVR